MVMFDPLESFFSGLNVLGTSVTGINLGHRKRTIPELDIPNLPQAVCKGYEPLADFHPKAESSGAKAKLICAGCPEKQACLDYAMNWERRHNERMSGVWGGHTESERARLRADEHGGVKLCRNGTHEMTGYNVVKLAAGGVRCRGCYNEATNRSKRAARETKRVANG
ncbi:Transcription factor WhiB [Mycobacteroides abscessus subsp. abscessus]|nr:Transcription factor WhiB [Mycobacteroides abscessus subsp. abscessus]